MKYGSSAKTVSNSNVVSHEPTVKPRQLNRVERYESETGHCVDTYSWGTRPADRHDERVRNLPAWGLEEEIWEGNTTVHHVLSSRGPSECWVSSSRDPVAANQLFQSMERNGRFVMASLKTLISNTAQWKARRNEGVILFGNDLIQNLEYDKNWYLKKDISELFIFVGFNKGFLFHK